MTLDKASDMIELKMQDILNYLPHRYPFLLVDRVLELIPDESITAIKNVTMNDDFFNGHFPGQPVMPGVLMLEALAQAGAILSRVSELEAGRGAEIYYLAGVDKARFKRVVEPGDQLKLSVEVIRRRETLGRFKCEATVNGELACSAEMMSVKSPS